jgi:hypothetical protein
MFEKHVFKFLWFLLVDVFEELKVGTEFAFYDEIVAKQESVDVELGVLERATRSQY